MAKFAYKMQNILDIKHKLESQAKTAYAGANNRLQQEESTLKFLYEEKGRYEDHIRTINSTRLNIIELKQYKEAIDLQKDKIKKQHIEVKVAEKNLELARIRLNDMMIDRKTHEKLREKAFEVFLKELDIAEKKEIDELVSFQHNKAE